jgi:putative ABC transport system permease protein
MNSILQMVAVSVMNLRNLPQRLGTSFIIVVGMAGVVGVLVSILAMASGAERAIAKTGREDRAIVLHAGAASELLSHLSRGEVATIEDAPAIARDSLGKPIASADAIVLIELPQRAGGPANLTLRGAGPQLTALRPELKIVEGRLFQAGLLELTVGRAAQRMFAGLDVGNQVKLNNRVWTVVGAFESDGDSHESEVLSDAETVVSAFNRDALQSVSVRLRSAQDFAAFRDALAANPRLRVSVAREADYYAEQSRPLARALRAVAYLVGAIMAVGAFFGAMNSMYSAVSTRTVEIATLRALGFAARPVVVSIFMESLLLATIGAALGAFLAWLLFGGHVVSTSGPGVAHSQFLFAMTVAPGHVAIAIAWACVIGAIGALFPAIHAARLPVAHALRRT